MTIIFDESHGESWTIRKDMALAIAPDRPENYYYGHLPELLHDHLGLTSRAMTEWSEAALRDASVLIIAHPCTGEIERNVGGSPIFQRGEIEQILAFVENGGGLLLISEFQNAGWKSNINEIGRRFGIEFKDDTAAVPRRDREFIVAQHFRILVSSNHPCTDEIYEITYHRGCTLSVDIAKCVKPLVSLPTGEIVCAAAKIGTGRVVAIGDSDLFALPFIGHSDNASFLANIVGWLMKKKVKGLQKQDIIVLKRGSEIHDLPKGQDLSGVPGDHILPVTMSAEQFSTVIEGLPDPYEQREQFLQECEFRFHHLPEVIRRAVINFKRRGNRFGALVLSAIPLDPELPPTPDNQLPPIDKKTFWSEAWLGMVGQALGDPIGYSVHHDKQIFQNICPIEKEEREQTAHSSTVFLEWHTEQAFHPELPDFVMLLCLRKDHEEQARTAIAAIPSILAEVPLIMRQILFQPRFRTGVDFSFGAVGSNQKKGGTVVSVFYGYGYDPFMKFDLDLMEPLDREAACALRRMQTSVKQVFNYVKLKPGDLMIVDNRRAIHARSGFSPRYDGTDRWLQRMYVRRDASVTDEERYRNERIIDTAFALGT
ncbi:TauD/TfdA family dioxygenase [Bradyrhizobium sp. BWA-3-5]|uniref:TauD/TfdA family dioxygenase n=1 Tax=Bradyrhizobium sp. BWA-3-5 TaxID=3080013 RepID=UPI00293E49DC|nr:TauD/TfdA family dioxygenase [Bradyrhizobium sp. BWA-3-5]WOH63873.1 TauD/TfdA family dioxygenase [Bradyrhizobium sp. BWA-3-5]